ncbi:Protein of unknown function [Microlunatus soli]|uniref:DUF3515 domain-containing protein n=2 Tax=Microlunatus soli TaxID=630515 RepID=A0A1H1ZFP2_9ACTN|nr:Protein of unknown function [Microlunatus soli]
MIFGAVVAALLVAVGGCAAEVPAPTPNAATAKTCRSLVSALPQIVDQQRHREVEPASDFTAAWGHPAITLACGVTKPAGMNAASKCWEVNGVGWYAEERDSDIRYTTLGRTALVQVTVPNKYTPQANALVDLAAPIKSQVPVVRTCV